MKKKPIDMSVPYDATEELFINELKASTPRAKFKRVLMDWLTKAGAVLVILASAVVVLEYINKL